MEVETVPAGMALAERKRTEPATVMVVDDDAGICASLQVVLEQHGYDAVVFESALDALDLLGRAAPDLILLDIDMPEMDGSELFSRLRALPRTRRTPVIFVTGLISPEEEAAFNDPGDRRHYLSKPYAVDKLMASVAALLRD